MKNFWKSLKNTKGQVAIFVALIFQVLFLFFAMVLNVGLLVHHKINLQNSVDLAAYYGAMKQAESMNAIAHINYQIRQSWKLLAWRYRVIGMAGNREWPMEGSGDLPYAAMSTKDVTAGASEDPNYYRGLAPQIKTMLDQPAFCVAFVPFKPMPPDENMCKAGINLTAINIFAAPPVIAGFMSLSTATRNATIYAQQQIYARCRAVSAFNWILLARFKIAYLQDVGERKKAINMLANGLSGVNTGNDPKADFLELNGDQASIGIKKTLLKNLTGPNRDSAQMEIYNSLGEEHCNFSTGDYLTMNPKWLNEINIKPSFGVAANDCQGGEDGGVIGRRVINLENLDYKEPSWTKKAFDMLYLSDPQNAKINQEFQALKDYIDPPLTPENPYKASLGFEKNPWCMAYVGVKATAKPKIPFSPLGDITLKAYSYAKPFGGRIGPWYYSNWSSASNKSQSGSTKTDENVPMRIDDLSNVGNITASSISDPSRIPNYSRFPGDTIVENSDPRVPRGGGLKSPAVLGYYWKAIHNINPTWAPGYALSSSLFPSLSPSSPSFDDWSLISGNFHSGNPEKDILAWDDTAKLPPQMRLLELSAVAPDLFDTTYYSIEPNFYQVYYSKIKEHQGKVPNGRNIALPSDFGSRIGDDKFEKFNVKNQIQVQNDIATTLDPKNTLQYQIRNVDHLLTGWVSNNLLEYDFAPDKFGKCNSSEGRPDPSKPGLEIPGDCINGGRVGFSVKLVSGDYLRRTDLRLGGAASGAGPVANPPPSDW